MLEKRQDKKMTKQKTWLDSLYRNCTAGKNMSARYFFDKKNPA